MSFSPKYFSFISNVTLACDICMTRMGETPAPRPGKRRPFFVSPSSPLHPCPAQPGLALRGGQTALTVRPQGTGAPRGPGLTSCNVRAWQGSDAQVWVSNKLSLPPQERHPGAAGRGFLFKETCSQGFNVILLNPATQRGYLSTPPFYFAGP